MAMKIETKMSITNTININTATTPAMIAVLPEVSPPISVNSVTSHSSVDELKYVHAPFNIKGKN